jgi:hypothetical protein
MIVTTGHRYLQVPPRQFISSYPYTVLYEPNPILDLWMIANEADTNVLSDVPYDQVLWTMVLEVAEVC